MAENDKQPGADESQNDKGAQPDPAVEAEARKMGWRPRGEWQGSDESFIEAADYVRRGKEMLPIITANNERLMGEVARLRNELTSSREVIRAAQESIETLKQFVSTETLNRVKSEKKDLTAKLVQAKKDENVELEVELQNQLEEVNDAIKDATEEQAEAKAGGGKAKDDDASTRPDPSKDPVFQQWAAENAWFGSDPARTGAADAIANQLRRTTNLVGRAFLDKVTEEVNKAFGSARASQNCNGSRVEGGRHGGEGGGGGSGKKKSYASLPTEVKEVCDRLGARLVGKKGSGRAYETIEQWRAVYAEKYYTQEGT